MEGRTITLPGGLVDADGTVHREAVIVPLGGGEEELLAQDRAGPAAVKVTEVLARCVKRIGARSPVSAEDARRLLVADRDFILLQLRALTFGDEVCATIACPWPECGQRADVDFKISDIPIVERPATALHHRIDLPPNSFEGSDWDPAPDSVRLRLPNGEDQEQLSALLDENEAEALTGLLGRCIVELGDGQAASQELIQRLPPAARLEIERRMEALAPQTSLVMDVTCPDCHKAFTAPFHLQDFFFGELRTSREMLYREVHYLAYHYHWSEQEIMAMSRDRRRKYIAVLADEIERLNDAVA